MKIAVHLAAALVVVLVPAPPAVASSQAGGPKRPNLVFLLTDDQGVDAIEGDLWPNELQVHTPRLAQLASQGTVFPNTRVYPLCSPTRAALMTGREALSTGVTQPRPVLDDSPAWDRLQLQTQERTIAELLRELGYRTILIDKWHLGTNEERGMDPRSQGFDVYVDTRDHLPDDHPGEIGDEHVLGLVRRAGVVQQDAGVPAVGHEDPFGARPAESRLFVRFELDSVVLPSGFDGSDLVDAQLIVPFEADADERMPFATGTDTGELAVRRVTLAWMDDPSSWDLLFDAYAPERLGALDPPPHALVDPQPNQGIRGLPLPPGTPISFGRSAPLAALVQAWRDGSIEDVGLTVMARALDGLPDLSTDQRVQLGRSALLRLGFDAAP